MAPGSVSPSRSEPLPFLRSRRLVGILDRWRIGSGRRRRGRRWWRWRGFRLRRRRRLGCWRGGGRGFARFRLFLGRRFLGLLRGRGRLRALGRGLLEVLLVGRFVLRLLRFRFLLLRLG